MAHLKVGDIEIDGTDVRIAGAGGAGLTRDARDARAPHPALPPGATLRVLDHVPFRPAALIGMGSVTAAAGMLIGVLGLRAAQGGLFPIVLGAALLSLGGGTAILGGLKIWNRLGFSVSGPGFADPVTDEYVAELKSLIRTADTRNTVEVLASKLRWPERDVVRTLGWLQARGELREELDGDSGDFYYVSVKVPRDLVTRLSST